MKLRVQNDIKFGSNILSLEVPKQLKNKVKTGVDYIDCALGGEGFTASMVTLFGRPEGGDFVLGGGLQPLYKLRRGLGLDLGVNSAWPCSLLVK